MPLAVKAARYTAGSLRQDEARDNGYDEAITFNCHYSTEGTAERQGELTMEQFKILREWAEEPGVPTLYHLSKRGKIWSRNWHFDIGRTDHIPEMKK